MLFLAALALTVSAAPTPAPRPAVAPLIQAQATVRILSGVTLQLGQASSADGQQLRTTSLSTPQGVQPARFVEFE
jgi:hypothetical protein